MKLRCIAAMLLVLCLLLTGCVANVPDIVPAELPVEVTGGDPENLTAEESGIGEEEAGFRPVPWVPSNMAGILDGAECPDRRDDFYASLNFEWLQAAEIEPGHSRVGTISELEKESQKRVQALFTDEALTGHDADLVRQLYAFVSDMDSRNALGVEPLRPYVDKILSITTMKQLKGFLSGKPAFGLDVKLYGFDVEYDSYDSSRNVFVVYPTALLLDAADEYSEATRTELGKQKDKANRLLISGILTRLGFSEEEAIGLYESAISFEGKLAAHMMPRDIVNSYSYYTDNYSMYTTKELNQASSAFPLVDLMFSRGATKVPGTIVREPAWLEALNAAYTEENVEGIRSYLLCQLILSTAKLLDEQALELAARYDAIVTGSDGTYQLEDEIYNTMKGALKEELGKMYADAYISEQTIAEVQEIIETVKEGYRQLLRTKDWLSPETVERAIGKLDSMESFVCRPAAYANNIGLDFRGCGNLTEVMSRIRNFHINNKILRLSLHPEEGCWGNYGFAPQDVNAFYFCEENSINILAGMLSGAIYNPQASVEQKLAGVGYLIGHEISHAFDNNGALYDENGNMMSWWTEADSAAFRQKTEMVASYLSAMEPLEGEYLNGELQTSELIADMGSIAVLLTIAEGIEGFDYESFFAHYATIWRSVYTETMFEYTLSDPHAPDYVRINGVLQQFEKFHETFDVFEGDGMYLAPEQRVAVW